MDYNYNESHGAGHIIYSEDRWMFWGECLEFHEYEKISYHSVTSCSLVLYFTVLSG